MEETEIGTLHNSNLAKSGIDNFLKTLLDQPTLLTLDKVSISSRLSRETGLVPIKYHLRMVQLMP